MTFRGRVHEISSVTALASILVLVLAPLAYSQAPTPAIISEFRVKDPNGNDVTDKPLVAGGTYTFNFAVAIGTTLTDQILMSTNLEKVSDRYWTLENNYRGVDTNTWQPGGSSVTFKAEQGTARFSLIGKARSNVTIEKVKDNKTIHFPVKVPVLIISLQSTRNILDQRILNVTDQALIQYENALKSRKDLIANTQTIPQYSALAQSIVEQAQSLAAAGYVEEAANILAVIPSTVPSPPGVESTFLYVAAILGVIAALFAVMLVRANSNRTFIARQADDKAKKLDVLLVKATRIDKGLASEIESIKKELEDLSRR